SSNLGEFCCLGRDGVFRLFLEIRQMQVLEDEFSDLVDVYFGFVVFLTRLVACALPLSGPLTRLAVTPDHIADFGISVAAADVFLFSIVEPKLIFIERTDRNFYDSFPIGEDDRFIRDDRAEILLYCLAHTVFVSILIDLTLALQRPIVSLYGHTASLVA